MWLFEPHVPLPIAHHLLQNRGENVWLFEPYILSSSCVPSPTRKEREMCGSSSRTFLHPHTFSHNTGERNVRFFEPHISLCLSHTISRDTGERTCSSKNRMFSASRPSFPIEQDRECAVQRTAHSLPLSYSFPRDRRENMRFEEPHVLFLSRTISNKPGERT